MSLIQSLHQARKARLQRMAAAAGAAKPALAPASASRLAAVAVHVAKRDPAARYVLDRDYERAWAAALLGHTGHSERARSRPRIEEIQRATAHHFNVTLTDLLSTRRTNDVLRPRQVAMYLAKQLTPKSLPEIARRFGGRNHTTVLHAVRKIEQELATDAELAASIARINEALDYPERRL